MGAHSAGFESRSYLAPGGIAQLVEHRRCIPKVAGSNPAISTSGPNCQLFMELFGS